MQDKYSCENSECFESEFKTKNKWKPAMKFRLKQLLEIDSEYEMKKERRKKERQPRTYVYWPLSILIWNS